MGNFREYEPVVEISDKGRARGTSPATRREGKESRRYTYVLFLVVERGNQSRRESLLQ